jgi:hypothetical protein
MYTYCIHLKLIDKKLKVHFNYKPRVFSIHEYDPISQDNRHLRF